MAYNPDTSGTAYLAGASADQVHTFLVTHQHQYAGMDLHVRHLFDSVVRLAALVATNQPPHPAPLPDAGITVTDLLDRIGERVHQINKHYSRGDWPEMLGHTRSLVAYLELRLSQLAVAGQRKRS